MTTHGGITQLVEYPVHTRYVICSNQIAATRPVGQAVKTPPFHGGNMGSIPVRVTMKQSSSLRCEEFFFVSDAKESNPSNASARWALAARRLDGGCSLMKSIPVRVTIVNKSELFPDWGRVRIYYFYVDTQIVCKNERRCRFVIPVPPLSARVLLSACLAAICLLRFQNTAASAAAWPEQFAKSHRPGSAYRCFGVSVSVP